MRNLRWSLILMLLYSLWLSACATPPQSVNNVGNGLDDSRMIVVAVQNSPLTPLRAGSTRPGYASGQYAVSASAQGDLVTLAHDYGLQTVSQWPIELLEMHCALFAIPTDADRKALIARMQADSRVRLVQSLNVFQTRAEAGTEARADPYAGMQTNVMRMQLSEAHRLSQGNGVRVAVVDTGVDSSHPDLAGRVTAEYNLVDGDMVRFHRDRHGTAVAGVLAANRDNGVGMVGVAPEAKLMSIKACWEVERAGEAARCNSYTLAQAIAKAVRERAQIINLSLTGPDDLLLTALTERAIDKGVIVVGASSEAGSAGFPGNVPGVIAAASDVNAKVAGIHAPGEEVLTLVPGGRYDFASGDSLATAAVSGVAALLMAKDRNLDSPRMLQLLTASSTPLAADASPVVNACRAIARLTGVDNCARSDAR